MIQLALILIIESLLTADNQLGSFGNPMEQVDLAEVEVEGAPNEGGNDAGVPEEGREKTKVFRVAGAVVVGGIVGYVAIPLVVTTGLYYCGFTATGKLRLIVFIF